MTSAGVKTFRAVGGLVLALLLACTSAQMVESRGSSPYGPKNERPGGRVRYLLQGLGSIVTARRENAYEQMYEKCGGAYEIVREWDEAGDQITSVSGSSTTRASGYGTNSGYGWNAAGTAETNGSAVAVTSAQTYRNIDFECSWSRTAPAGGSTGVESSEVAPLPMRRRVLPDGASPTPLVRCSTHDAAEMKAAGVSQSAIDRACAP